MADDKFVVDGFRFKTKEEAIEAKNEYDGVQYMRSRTNMKNPTNVYTVYKNLIEKNLFKTPVGMKYLCELRAVLEASGQYSEEELLNIAIPVTSLGGKKIKKSKEKASMSKSDVIRNMKKYDIESTYRSRFINALIVNVLLIVVIVFVIIIANNSDNTNILNYKARIDAEYHDRENALVEWKKELDMRQEYIEQREKELENEPTDK